MPLASLIASSVLALVVYCYCVWVNTQTNLLGRQSETALNRSIYEKFDIDYCRIAKEGGIPIGFPWCCSVEARVSSNSMISIILPFLVFAKSTYSTS